ncbi:MAG: hypothetical protein BWZ07_02796 [Alphaproteobacteria bacterium ADurb.BinA280]|nr:MAG: hypothetical protein BWZ07_02796 [Alphaproteobacteria bacterium ADurb.BinA280]
MDDTSARTHPVHRTGWQALNGLQAIAMDQFTLEQKCQRAQPDMRVWRHLHALAG